MTNDVSKTRQAVNPFEHLPKGKSDVIREHFFRTEWSDKMSFEEYLRVLHEEDDMSPEEMLDVIKAGSSKDWRVFPSAEELLKDLHKKRR